MSSSFNYTVDDKNIDIISDEFVILIKTLENINIEDYLSPQEKLLLNN